MTPESQRITPAAQRGMTLVEALVVTMIIALITALAGSYSMNWLRSERLRASLYQTYVQVSMARVEAVNRNRACRFTIDTATRQVRVIDLNDPAFDADDTVVQTQTLDSNVRFGTPSGGTAITLNNPSDTLFEVTFGRTGSVASGSGSIHFQQGANFKRVSVFAGGAVAVERWNGSAWQTGS